MLRAPEATPVKPNNPASTEITKKIRAHFNIVVAPGLRPLVAASGEWAAGALLF